MKIVIVTGLSGSGKSEAMKVMEDMDFYCVDNLPPALIPKFVEVCSQSQGMIEKVALGIDIRGYQFFKDLDISLKYMEKQEYKFDILFLEADSNVLVRRYKMTRRKHPLSSEDNILPGIEKEKDMLKLLRKEADHIIDTTNMSPRELKDEVINLYNEGNGKSNLIISVMSFGFKHGIPLDADLVFDVRFMPNPYYIPELKEKTGDDIEVRDYVMNSNESQEFKEKLEDMVDFLVPNYIKEGKNHIVIAIGCTGGRHRSVTITNLLYDYLKSKGYRVLKKHRDYTLK